VTRPKLLLADDSVTIRKVVELTFADEGVDVTAVADAESAMMKFIEIQPDIVLVDIGLPGINGYKICEMIKEDETTAHIPVLLLVGSFEPFDHDEAEKARADGFLTKPFHSIRDLVARVNDLLGKAEAPAETPENEDIHELYQRSFAETVPIDNYETVPAFAADDAFTEPVTRDTETAEEALVGANEWLDDQLIETVGSELSETPAEEDISVDPAENDLPPDETETLKPDGSAEPEVAFQEAETVDDGIVSNESGDNVGALQIDTEPIKEFDWSPAAIVSAADNARIGAAAGFSATFVPEEQFISPPPGSTSEHITEEMHDLNTDEMPELGEAGNGAIGTSGEEPPNPDVNALDNVDVSEPSREFIDLVARRVVERLSDRVIREIAQEAVPRIAEKLMREALDEEASQ
jgi:CheY-like chemotaxis protein